MKQIASLILVLMMFSVGALASAIDWSDTPDDELVATIEELTEMLDSAKAELENRNSSNDNTSDVMSLTKGGLLFEINDISVYFDPGYRIYHSLFGSGGEGEVLEVNGYIDNQSDTNIYLSITDAKVNSWQINSWGGEDISAGCKAKATFSFVLADANVTSFDEIEDFEVAFNAIDDSYDSVFETESFKIVE